MPLPRLLKNQSNKSDSKGVRLIDSKFSVKSNNELPVKPEDMGSIGLVTLLSFFTSLLSNEAVGQRTKAMETSASASLFAIIFALANRNSSTTALNC